MFWGIVLKADKRYEQTVEEGFHISKACLEPSQNGKVCSVYLEQDNEEFILCNLSPKNLNESLDLNFNETEKICFRVEGGGNVHLTGYLMPEDDEDDFMQPMVDMSDEDMEEDEEVPPKLVKKRKLENGTISKENPLEETKNLKKKKEGEHEESSEEDSSDDEADDSKVTVGSSFFDSSAVEEEEDDDDDSEEGEEEEESDEEGEFENDSESEGISDEDSGAVEAPKKPDVANSSEEKKEKQGTKNEKESPKSVEKEKPQTPKPDKTEKKAETPIAKKENGESKTDTPASKKNKKNKQLLNGIVSNGPNTPNNKENKTPVTKPAQINGVQTPKTETKPPNNGKESNQTPKSKDGKAAKDNPAAQTPNKTPKRTLKGGLMVEDLKLGNGPEAKASKMVGMYYAGKLKSNNKQFDACQQGKPFMFRLGRGEVIKGWDVGVEGMKVGGKRRLTVPANMGYGSQGAPPDIPPNATLVFDVECKAVR